MIPHLTATRGSVIVALALAFSPLVACDREPATPPPPASTPTPPANPTSDPAPVPGKGAEVTEKGTQTGMVGGESGTVASSGKPGSGTDSGAGTGPAESSGSKVENKK